MAVQLLDHKRIDEIDQASPSAIAELLSYLDYQRAGVAVLATTNDYEKLRAATKGRLETRFKRFNVTAPGLTETAAYLARQFGLPIAVAREVAKGTVPDGCLATVGCNVRAAVEAVAALRDVRQPAEVAA